MKKLFKMEDKETIKEFTDKELKEEAVIILTELRDRDLEIPQVDKY